MCLPAMAYLHWKGWEWTQCRIVLQALHCFTDTASDSWTVLQYRLQLQNWQIHAMIKTHPQLEGYSASLIERNIASLEENLKLPLSRIQRVVLLQPSILGMSPESVQNRVDFWTNTVGLSLEDELSRVIQSKPALLQYSLENLRKKHRFFVEQNINLKYMTIRYPTVWGKALGSYEYLLDEVLRPYNATSIVKRAPILFQYNPDSLKLKMEFLQEHLGLDRPERVGDLVQRAPSLLMHSIKTIKSKIQLLEGKNFNVLSNPSLLLNSKSRLAKRLATAKTPPDIEALSVRGRSRPVWLICKGGGATQDHTGKNVVKEFATVAEAAEHAGMSASNMYKILRRDDSRVVGGERLSYVYGSASAKHLGTETPRRRRQRSPAVAAEITKKPSLVVYTSGQAYPPEATIRGRRRGGGMSISIPCWSGETWEAVLTTSPIYKNRQMRLANAVDTTATDGKMLLLGYPYTRPSRSRCSLYVCREALLLVREWMRLFASSEHPREIIIVSDSNQVVEALSRYHRMSASASVADAAETKTATLLPKIPYRFNPDILEPLRTTVDSLRTEFHVSVRWQRAIERLMFATSAKSKRSTGVDNESVQVLDEKSANRLLQGARWAARRMYNQ